MNIRKVVVDFLRKYVFNATWKCVACRKEIFDGGYFCDKCKNELPRNDGVICNHCGRKLNSYSEYCSTCKGTLLSIDKARSAFIYEEPISKLVKDLKYHNARYVADVFVEELSHIYFKNYFNADILTFVPMTEKAKRKRGYNQSELIAERLSEKIGVPNLSCLAKIKETDRQAKLNKEQRRTNLMGAFKVLDKTAVKDKSVVIVDDVTTTGATGEAIASKLKKAGAAAVYLLTVASVPNKDGY